MKYVLLLIIQFILVDCKPRPFNESRRIIGGKKASIHDAPFIGSVIMKLTEPNITIFSGGAAIIGKYWAITAAHCVYDFNEDTLSDRQGFVRSNTSEWQNGTYKRDHLIDQCIIHEEYIHLKEDYDIALMKVKEPFDGLFEIPIQYASVDYEYVEKTTATTLGWGSTEIDISPFTVSELRQVDVQLSKQDHCKNLYNNINISVTSRMVCGGAPGKDACVNDSGGPLIQHGDVHNITLIGLVSWGVACASNTFPGVYTKLSEFDKWIACKVDHLHRYSDIAIEYDSNSCANITNIDMYEV